MGAMDITVTNVGELPPNTYISVRYGDARRLSAFRKGEILSFPGLNMDHLPKAYTVDVFRKVGTKQVSLAGISAMGGKVSHDDLSVPSLEISGYPVKVSLSALLSATKSTKSESDNKKQQVALKAKRYLEKHGIQDMLREMFTLLLERLPVDPIAFMSDYLEEKKEELEEQAQPPADYAEMPGLGDFPLPGFADDGSSPEVLPPLDKHHTLAADILRQEPEVYQRLKHLTTRLNVALGPCIKPGIDCPGHELVKVAGCYAGDEECYDTFQELFDPILAAIHGRNALCHRHPHDEDPAKLPNIQIDPTGRYATSATIEARRNLQGACFSTSCSKEERRQVEHMVANALLGMGGELRGQYYPLRGSTSFAERASETNGWQVSQGMGQQQEQQLRRLGALFSEPDSRMQLAAGLGRHWPDARGVFITETQTVHVWCNEEDHVRFFAKQQGAVDIKALWKRLSGALAAVESVTKLQGHGWSRSSRLGYLTTCPSRVGTAMRISVVLRLPCLSQSQDVAALCRSLRLEATQDLSVGTADGNLWNITNSDVLGISEVDTFSMIEDGCSRLAEAEQRLERGEPIFSVMPGLGELALPGFPATGRYPARMPDLEGYQSLVARVLLDNPELWREVRGRKTPGGISLAPCIKPAMDEPSAPLVSPSGLVAGDGACYDTFADLFDKVLELLHGEDVVRRRQPSDVDCRKIANIELPLQHVVAVRAEVRRNIDGITFGPCCSRAERREVERLAVRGLLAICRAQGWEGDYKPLAGSSSYVPRPGGVSADEQARMYGEGVLFSEPVFPGSLAAGFGRSWPEARGSFVVPDHGVHFRCNEEDHIRIVSGVEGGDVKMAFARVMEWSHALEMHLSQSAGRQYARTARLGILTASPENVGAGLRCAVRLRLPHLGANEEFVRICAGLRLLAAWAGDGAWEVASGSTLGISEVDLVNMLLFGCAQLIKFEQALERGESISEELDKLVASTS